MRAAPAWRGGRARSEGPGREPAPRFPPPAHRRRQQLNAVDTAIPKARQGARGARARGCAAHPIPRVAEITVARLFAEMPERDRLGAKAAATLAGLAPIARETGKSSAVADPLLAQVSPGRQPSSSRLERDWHDGLGDALGVGRARESVSRHGSGCLWTGGRRRKPDWIPRRFSAFNERTMSWS